MKKKLEFEKNSFGKRLGSMLSVDFRRMFTMPFFYIMAGTSFVMPILVLVMTTMFSGDTMVNPQTGVETTMDAFTNTWQAIGTISSENSMMSMGLTAMCNINLIFFLACVLVCVFVAADFRSGYCKNLFTVRSRKTDYIISKTLVCMTGCVGMLIVFFVGAVIGGAIAGLPFELGTAGVSGLVMCMLSKIFLMGVFVAIYLLLSVIAKEKSWLSILLSLMVGMLFFMMIPMLTPLDSTMMNVILCLAGGVLFSVGLGAVSNVILKKKDIL